jgi:hypothetical protein
MTSKLLVLLVPVAACRSVDGDNQGEAIATMHGAQWPWFGLSAAAVSCSPHDARV